MGEKNIAVLRLSGVISSKSSMKSGLCLESLNENIEQCFKLPKLEAVFIIINSPGGSPAQSELISSRLRSLANKNKVPLIGFVEDVAASGGYWLACSCDEIYALNNSIVGSIGVISSGFGFQETIKKLGIERRIYTQGKNKSILDPFKPENKEDIELIKGIQKIIHDNFIEHVKAGRNGKLDSKKYDTIFNGQFWTSLQAKELGLIDGVKNMYDYAEERFGEDINFKYISPKQSWLKRKMGISSNIEHSHNIDLGLSKEGIIEAKF